MFLALEFTTPAEHAVRCWTDTRARAFIAAAVDLTGLQAIHQIGGTYGDKVMLIQLIAESHIAVHLNPKDEPAPYGAVHVFSCRDFDEADMIKLTAQFFVADHGTVLARSLPRGELPEMPYAPTS
jgi:S-adenosylmethionine/arginine decarboxylase-like enzyme